MKRSFTIVAIVAAIVAATRVAADPLRLRADALATTAAPAGLLVLEADGKPRPGLSAGQQEARGVARAARQE